MAWDQLTFCDLKLKFISVDAHLGAERNKTVPIALSLIYKKLLVNTCW